MLDKKGERDERTAVLVHHHEEKLAALFNRLEVNKPEVDLSENGPVRLDDLVADLLEKARLLKRGSISLR